MKIQIESTSHVTMIEMEGRSIPARVWEGSTESGVPVHCYITRIAPTIPRDDPRQVQFERELKECVAPTVPAIPLRMIL